MSKSQAGRLGGRATRTRYGRAHLKAIAAKGFAATVARHWQGDKKAYLEFLRRKARLTLGDVLASRTLDKALNDGASIACVEVAPFDNEDFDCL